jgi:hypothetical protein
MAILRFPINPSEPCIFDSFGPSEMLKCLLQQVQNGFICWIRMRNGCVRAKRKKQWLMASSQFNPPFWSFEKKILLRYFFIERSILIQIFNWFAFNLNWLYYGKFMLGGHLDFLRYFVFLCSNLFFLPKYIIRFTLNSIASGMKIALPLIVIMF